jgi:hypothetical protein
MATRKVHADHVLDHALEQFHGKTADQIAEIVRRRGIKGRMGTTSKCPMALLLDSQASGKFVIGRQYIARRSGSRIEKARTPVNVAQFMRRFDIGFYPDLIMPPPRCLTKPGDKRKAAPGKKPGPKRSPWKNRIAKMVNRFNEPQEA